MLNTANISIMGNMKSIIGKLQRAFWETFESNLFSRNAMKCSHGLYQFGGPNIGY